MNAPAPMVVKPEVTAFFHEATHTVTYIVHEDGGRSHAIIDSALDYDTSSGRTATNAADEAEFVALRAARDAELRVPSLILPVLQVNIRAGALPPPEDNGVSYLKIPLNAL